MSYQEDTAQPSRPPSDAADAFLFLSYNGADRAIVQSIQTRLEQMNVSTFFDRDRLQPGLPWFDALQDAIGKARAVAVFIGKDGLGTWQKREMELALERQARAEKLGLAFPVIPVVLPGVDLENVAGFVLLNTWIDLRSSIDEDRALEEMASVVLGKHRAIPTASAALCPYRALRAFREEDASLFFGREAFAAELLRKVVSHEVVVVVGRSGSGKTSVVQAGLLPLLRREHSPAATWDVVIFSPGKRPFHNLAAGLVTILESESGETQRLREAEALGNALAGGTVALESAVRSALKKTPGSDRLLLVVDQFEELFTLTPEPERRSFVESLLEVVSTTPVTVLLTLRADFYGQAINVSRDLSDRMQSGVVNLGSMTTDELRRVIETPARTVGLEFESGLVERILENIEDQPGNLPLLEFALTALWEMRKGHLLSNQKYDEIGGIKGAISKRADAQFNNLTPQQQASALRLFSRLGAVSEDGTTYARQQVSLRDLDESQQSVVQSFVGARLLVTNRNELTGEETVEVAHEALIRAWAKLREFLDNDRQFHLWRQRLEDKKDEWLNAEKDHELLLRGPALVQAKRRLRERPEDFSDSERAFIKSSESVTQRSRRRLIIIAAAAVFVLSILAGVALWVRSDSYQVNSVLAQGSKLTESASPPAIRRWVKALTYAGKLDEALRLTRNLKELDQRALTLSEIAYALHRLQKVDDAKSIIREAQSTATNIEERGPQFAAFHAIFKESIKVRNVDECVAASVAIESIESRTQALVALARALITAERVDEANRVIDEALQATRLIKDPELQALGFARTAELLLNIKNEDRSRKVLDEGLETAKQIKDPADQSLVYGQLTSVLFQAGVSEKANEAARLTYSAWRRVTKHSGMYVPEIADAVVKAGKGEEIFEEALATWETNEDVLVNPLKNIMAIAVAMNENGMREKVLVRISNIPDETIQYYCYIPIVATLTEEGKTAEAVEFVQKLSPELRTFLLLTMITTLDSNDKPVEALSLANQVGLASNSLFLLFASGNLADNKHIDDALTMARNIDVNNVKGFALSNIVRAAVKFEPEKAQAILDETLSVAQNVSNDQLRSAIYLIMANAQARLNAFRNARLIAQNCATSDEVLLVYRTILLQHVSRHNPQLTALLQDEEKENENGDLNLGVVMGPDGLRYDVQMFPSERTDEGPF